MWLQISTVLSMMFTSLDDGHACVRQASERIGAAGGKAEAALFGVLAGHSERVLPLCASWEDAAWALARRCACSGRGL